MQSHYFINDKLLIIFYQTIKALVRFIINLLLNNYKI